MNYFTVDILTPSKIVAKGIPAESVVLSTSKGQIAILPAHTHLVTELSTGKVTIFGGADDSDRIFSVTKGTCKVLENKVVILTQVSEEDKNIDIERAKLALENALSRLKSGSLSSDELIKFRRKAERASLRIQMFGESKK